MDILKKNKNFKIKLVTDNNIENAIGKFDANKVYDESEKLEVKRYRLVKELEDMLVSDIENMTLDELYYRTEILQ